MDAARGNQSTNEPINERGMPKQTTKQPRTLYSGHVCLCMHARALCLSSNKLHSNTHKLDHWWCKQRFHCSFCWLLTLRPLALLLPIPPSVRLISTFSSELGHLECSRLDNLWHSKLGVITSQNYFQIFMIP